MLVAWGCSSADDGGQPAAALVASDFQVVSPSFTEIRPRKRIPVENTCFGDNFSPPLTWSDAPPNTQSFALIADEPEHETGSWVHWVLYNIPAEATALAPGIPTSTDSLPDGTKQGRNDFKSIGYNGPCPPPTVLIYDTHYSRMDRENVPLRRYKFTLYALDAVLDLAAGATRDELTGAMEGHIVAQVETTGKYAAKLELDSKQDTQAPANEATPAGEKIYNTRGDLITPTPTGGQ